MITFYLREHLNVEEAIILTSFPIYTIISVLIQFQNLHV